MYDRKRSQPRVSPGVLNIGGQKHGLFLCDEGGVNVALGGIMGAPDELDGGLTDADANVHYHI